MCSDCFENLPFHYWLNGPLKHKRQAEDKHLESSRFSVETVMLVSKGLVQTRRLYYSMYNSLIFSLDTGLARQGRIWLSRCPMQCAHTLLMTKSKSIRIYP